MKAQKYNQLLALTSRNKSQNSKQSRNSSPEENLITVTATPQEKADGVAAGIEQNLDQKSSLKGDSILEGIPDNLLSNTEQVHSVKISHEAKLPKSEKQTISRPIEARSAAKAKARPPSNPSKSLAQS